MRKGIILLALFLLAAGQASGSDVKWKHRRWNFPLDDGKILVVSTSCMDTAVAHAVVQCRPRDIMKDEKMAAEEVVNLYNTSHEALASLLKSARSKADLDGGTALMIQSARERVQKAEAAVTDTGLWSTANGNPSRALDMWRAMKKDYQQAGELMKAATPGLARAESKEQVKARAEEETANAARRQEKSKDLASGVALAEIPTVGRMDLGAGGPQAGGGRHPARVDVEKHDDQRGNLAALREGSDEPQARTGRLLAAASAPAAFTQGSASMSQVPGAPIDGRAGAPGAVTGPDGKRAGDPEGGQSPVDSQEGDNILNPAEKGPGAAQAFVDKAWELIMSGDYAKAEEAARKALELDPKNAAALEVLALAQVKQGKFEDAVRSASAAIDLDPSRANAWAFRAYAKELLGDRFGGLADLEQAAKLDPHYAEKYRLAKAGGRIFDPNDPDPFNLGRRRGRATYLPYAAGLLVVGGALAWELRRRRSRAGVALASLPGGDAPPSPQAGPSLHLVQVSGKTMRQTLAESGRAEWRRAVDVCCRLCLALEDAERLKLAYSPVTPEDVLLGTDGQVRLLPTVSGASRGSSASRFYRAPDWKGNPNTDAEGAIFSVGVCLYESLTGRLPFDRPEDALAMKCVPPSRVVAGLPPALDEVFLRAMQPDPNLRIRTPAEFRERLIAAVRPTLPAASAP